MKRNNARRKDRKGMPAISGGRGTWVAGCEAHATRHYRWRGQPTRRRPTSGRNGATRRKGRLRPVPRHRRSTYVMLADHRAPAARSPCRQRRQNCASRRGRSMTGQAATSPSRTRGHETRKTGRRTQNKSRQRSSTIGLTTDTPIAVDEISRDVVSASENKPLLPSSSSTFLRSRLHSSSSCTLSTRLLECGSASEKQ